MDYVGQYTRIKNRLIPKSTDQKTIYLRSRKKDLNRKPKEFIIEKKGDKMVYISSLYPTTTANEFKFDKESQVFSIYITDDIAIIKEY